MFRLKSRFITTGFLVFLSGAALIACGEDEGPSGDSSAGKSSHNSGRNCIGCHGDLKYAGTVYTDSTGSTIAAGETVVITEADGRVIPLVTDRSGNFYSSSGNPSGGYSATVQGNTVGMAASQTNGACSASGCHDGTTSARVYKN